MAGEQTERADLREKAETCSGVVIYDDVPARDLAIALWEGVARTFKGELEFEFSWWRVKYLMDSEIARQAALAAVKADLVVLSLQNPGTLLPAVDGWFEQWRPQRARSEGALVVLREHRGEWDWKGSEYSYFESLARRAQLDYLLVSRPAAELRPPDRLREDEVLPNLIGVFPVPDQQYHSSGWGINE